MSTLGAGRERLIGALQRCATAAEHSASAANGLRDVAGSVESCKDAAELCRLGAVLIARGSDYEEWVLLGAILAAEACASECEAQVGAFFDECAEACRAVPATAERSVDELRGDLIPRVREAAATLRRDARRRRRLRDARHEVS